MCDVSEAMACVCIAPRSTTPAAEGSERPIPADLARVPGPLGLGAPRIPVPLGLGQLGP